MGFGLIVLLVATVLDKSQKDDYFVRHIDLNLNKT